MKELYFYKMKVRAGVYEKGMEDGFSCEPYTTCTHSSDGWTWRGCHECPLEIPKKPYISKNWDKFFIDEGDYIVFSPDGLKHIYKPDIFEKNFEKIE